ncbi:hypothetical protein INS49_013685 [Diaporthe citri]|uniref:uncharacterized protein n=1 Tax=Diaporthe citri TaxID=83186 RepID=UPI001C7F1176|nr:uncharacterized protein INS49_013685 [Diaporthe citri]KAG6357806.1 hypothetical protein INS49_013685 [Diaporthe citri]
MPSPGEQQPTDRSTTQATCRTFRLLAQEILSHPPRPLRTSRLLEGQDPSTATSLNPVLAQAFAPLFSSAVCFTSAERKSRRWFLSLIGDVALPFRRLPWAACGGDDGNTALRDAYLRPAASWRGLSVTFARGPPVTRLEVVKSYSSEDFNEDGRDHMQHLLVDLSASGGFLTMGLLYDLLLCGGAVGDDSAATFGAETGAWDLLLGRRLRSYDLLVEYECFIPGDEELVDSGPGAEGSAILYVRGGTVEVDDQDRRFEEPEEDDVAWVPEILGDMPMIRLANVS